MAASDGCPSPERLRQMLLGRLSEQESAATHAHLERCADCLRWLDSCRIDDPILAAIRGRAKTSEASDDPLVRRLIAAARGGQSGKTSTRSAPERSTESSDSSRPPSPIDVAEDFRPDVDLDTVIRQLEATRIVDPDRLRESVPPAADPKDAAELVRDLVRRGQLTKFQARRVVAGRAASLIHGNYTILGEIGGGGMGRVYRAHHRRMDRIVAIKMLPTAHVRNPEAIARFEREVRAAAKLTHPNIVAALDADQADGNRFLVMEYVEGTDLAALLRQNGPLTVDQAIDYIVQVAEGLEYAHKKGVVHRDIKPANLLLDREGTVKILDMGLARFASHDGNEIELTGADTVMGTVDYMSPEQAVSSKSADARADVYSLGCTLFALLAGRPMFEEESVTARLLAHQTQPVPSLAGACNGVSDRLDAVFRKMVAKNRAERYQSMADVVADLRYCLNSTGSVIAPSPITEPKEAPLESTEQSGGAEPQPRTLSAVAGAGALLLSLALWIVIRDEGGTPIPPVEVLDGGGATVHAEPVELFGDVKPEPIAAFRLETTTNSVGMKLVSIPAGDFMMGSKPGARDAKEDEEPWHPVRISKRFYLGQTEVTQGQWRAVMSTTPWRYKDYAKDDDSHPAAYVTYEQADAFCKSLGSQEGKVYRLPTEAEWEYACRAGTVGQYSCGDAVIDLGNFAWCEMELNDGPHPVARKRPNAWGLYDMHGNVGEWCQDGYHSEFYWSLLPPNLLSLPSRPVSVDPCNSQDISKRVIRGGSWWGKASDCRSAARSSFPQDGVCWDLGFRVVLVASE